MKPLQVSNPDLWLKPREHECRDQQVGVKHAWWVPRYMPCRSQVIDGWKLHGLVARVYNYKLYNVCTHAHTCMSTLGLSSQEHGFWRQIHWGWNPGFSFYLLALWLWRTFLTTLNLIFLICKKCTVIPTPCRYCEDSIKKVSRRRCSCRRGAGRRVTFGGGDQWELPR